MQHVSQFNYQKKHSQFTNGDAQITQTLSILSYTLSLENMTMLAFRYHIVYYPQHP